jgi:Large ribosomal RNA subunit accumulation protein YceD
MTRAMKARGTGGPWQVPVSVHDVPASGRRFELEADAATRAAIAKSAGLRALPRLQASFDVSRHGADGLHVVGRVQATIGQECVVSLDPIDNEVEETVELIFVAGATPGAGDAPGRETMEIGDVEPPEPLLDDTVDLGAIATEFLLLGIEPYPRKPDAVFQEPAIEDESEHPFAALAALRKGQGRRDQ